MTIHITIEGVLMVIGGGALLWFVLRLLYLLYVIARWGK